MNLCLKLFDFINKVNLTNPLKSFNFKTLTTELAKKWKLYFSIGGQLCISFYLLLLLLLLSRLHFYSSVHFHLESEMSSSRNKYFLF